VKPYLLIDNYDSFTLNLIHSLSEIADQFEIWRNDEFTLEELARLNPEIVMISPGPGKPQDSGLCLQAIDWAVKNKKPLLGICLGHQAIGEYFGAQLQKAQKVMHGKSSIIEHDGRGLFKGLPQDLEVGRYHSLALEKHTFPDVLEITATTLDDGEIMALRHKTLPIEALQFHPESILTPDGKRLLKNFFP
jgi:anthranilate synthase component 2